MRTFKLLVLPVLSFAMLQACGSTNNLGSNNLSSNVANTNNVATPDKGLSPINLILSKDDQYLSYYDKWDDNKIAAVRDKSKVIFVHPGDDFTNISSDQVEKLKNGNSTKVFGYLTIGEDETCSGDKFTNQTDQLKCARERLPYNDKLGPLALKNGTTILQKNGYPSYLVALDGGKEPTISKWHSFYIDAGSDSWKKLVLERAVKVANLGVDGFFLDTLDTAQDFKESRHGMLDLISQLKNKTFNNKQMILIANRGLFFFKKGQCEICKSVSGVMFENLFTEQCVTKGDNDGKCKEASSGMKSEFLTNGNGGTLSDLREVQTEYPNLRVLVLEYVGRNQKDPPCKELLTDTLDKLTKGISVASPSFSYDGRYPYYIVPGELNIPKGGSSDDYFPIFTSTGKLDYGHWCK